MIPEHVATVQPAGSAPERKNQAVYRNWGLLLRVEEICTTPETRDGC